MALPWINQSSFIAAITEGLIHIFHLHFNLTSTKMSCFERDLKNAPQNAAPMALETRRYKTAATAQFMLKLKKSKKNFVENILDYFFIYLLFWLLQYLPVIGVVRVVFRGSLCSRWSEFRNFRFRIPEFRSAHSSNALLGNLLDEMFEKANVKNEVKFQHPWATAAITTAEVAETYPWINWN